MNISREANASDSRVRRGVSLWSAGITWICLILGSILLGQFLGHAAESTPFSPRRVPWTSSQLSGSPEPPALCQVRRVYPQLTFKDPVDICIAPGSDRIFLAQQSGKIHSFKAGTDPASADLFADISQIIKGANTVYGITFHPGFQTNRYVYICYVIGDGIPDGSRVARFKVSNANPPRLDPASHEVLITWRSGGHNGGCIKFGPDQHLYISTGDAAGPNPADPLKTGQDNTDLLSAILRIDVNQVEPGRPYRVPADNPFVGQPDSRPEIWAYGFRNPWRMSFDAKTGALWVGDVGWELWEMVYQVERGGNYGWSIVEGPQSIHPDWPKGPSPILPPIKSHPHSEAASITGGFVYYGRGMPNLVGAYIYGDWVTGKIWALRTENDRLKSVAELVDTQLQIVSFGEDNEGEILIIDTAGTIHQLELNPAPKQVAKFPHKLSETGLFESTPAHQLAPGVLPFRINAEMWADGAIAERFVGLPGHSSIKTRAMNLWVYQSKSDWGFPTNGVLGKTLSIDFTPGDPSTRRRLETQILLYDGTDWRGYTYRWNESQTDALLVEAAGDEALLQISDPGRNQTREQRWRFHSRSECLRCHNMWDNFALAFTGAQLNRDLTDLTAYARTELPSARQTVSSNSSPNQLRVLSKLGFFDQPLDERVRPTFRDPYDSGASLNERARSWLHVNCAHCHRNGAGGSVPSHLEYELRLRSMNVLGRPPSQGALGLREPEVIRPGDPYSSVLYYRIATLGQGRMPLIGSTQVDARGLRLIHDWIQTLPQRSGPEDSAETTGAPPAADPQALAVVRKPDISRSERTAALEKLLSSANGTLALLSDFDSRTNSVPPSLELLQAIAAHPAFYARDLFERHMPESLRSRKLGFGFDTNAVLALTGSVQRGKSLFFQESLQCSRCHRVSMVGNEFGPDLSHIGGKYSKHDLLDQIASPSKIVDVQFRSYQIETSREESYLGLLLKRTPEEIVVKDANLVEIRIPANEVAKIQARELSIMPEGLIQSMTAQEAADLLEFLSSLK